MSEAACRALTDWRGALVSLTVDGDERVRLLARIEQAALGTRERLVLDFGSGDCWRFPERTRFTVNERRLVAEEPDGRQVTVQRLLLPASVRAALHVGSHDLSRLGLRSFSAVPSWAGPPTRALPRTDHVVVWLEGGALARLQLWWVCASARRGTRISVVPIPGESWMHSLADVATLMNAAAGLRPFDARTVAHLAANWRRWSAGDVPGDVQLPRWPRDARWVGEVPEACYAAMPRLERGRLRLSVDDEAMLGLLDAEAFTDTLRVIMRGLRGPAGQNTLIRGDLSFARRLDAWARFERGRYVERRRSPREDANRFTRWEYRRTPAGTELLQRGLPALTSAPPLHLGGFRLYTWRSPWVLHRNVPRRLR